MSHALYRHLEKQLAEVTEQGLFKQELTINSPQDAIITLESGEKLINLCANNYLGLSNHPTLITAAKQALNDFGFGMSSVRFICGTQSPHVALEQALSSFLEMDDTILYSSCFDANTGLFETLLGPEDAIISDSLNHASVIDGIRLCKAKRFRYQNNDMASLEEQLKQADARFRLIATDGVFSMDGTIANLKAICDLAEKYDAIVMVDDSHAVGFLGELGKGSLEYCDVMGRVDIVTGTLGKALGGASGGYVSGKKPIIDWLRQRSRPYLFSNATAPVVTHTGLTALNMLKNSDDLRRKLKSNSEYFRSAMTKLGFSLAPGNHPIIPVMLGDAKLANQMASLLLDEGLYVVGFSYPVVPKGQARIRTQMSAAHEIEHLDIAIAAFEKVGQNLGVLKR